LEPEFDYSFEEDIEEIEEFDESIITVEEDETTEPHQPISEENMFVEVGDRVTYCFIDKPEEKYTVMIVDTESDPRLNLINEKAALACALLNAAVGDETELELKKRPTRTIRILQINRQNADSDGNTSCYQKQLMFNES